VQIVEQADVSGFVKENGNAVAAKTSRGEFRGKCFVVACGALTPFLNKHLGCKIAIQPGKGYSITMPRPKLCPTHPMIFEQHRVAITPMKSGYRIGSTMEFSGYDSTINERRLSVLKDSARLYLREPYTEPIQEKWFGWRPMTWDSKPYIDRAPAFKNVWVAAGHNMLGLSMATVTGKLISELINGQPTHLDVQALRLDRT
jgi:D-amino-acid dehydrogenase